MIYLYVSQPLKGLKFPMCNSPCLLDIAKRTQPNDFDSEGVAGLEISSSINVAKLSLANPDT